MATLNLYTFLSVEINGKESKFGSLGVPSNLSVTLPFEKVLSVAPSTIINMFDVTKDLTSFQFMLLVSDLNLMVELTTDVPGAVGIQYYTLPLIGSGTAGKFGIPLILPGNASYGNYTNNFAGGTIEAVGRIKVKNLDPSLTAQCLAMAFQ